MSPRAGQLSAQQRRSLERDGYLLVPSLLDEAAVARMAGRLAEFVRQTVDAWDADPAPDIDDSSEADLDAPGSGRRADDDQEDRLIACRLSEGIS